MYPLRHMSGGPSSDKPPSPNGKDFPAFQRVDSAAGPFGASLGEAEESARVESPRGIEDDIPSKPTTRQLWQVFLISSIPFIGFGFADNVIMILAGDMIDKSLGMRLGLSTLAAAGLGNLISDVCGIGLGDVFERGSQWLGIKEPKMNRKQSRSKSARWTKTVGCMLGISLGCLLGMFPLLFLHDNKELFFSKDDEKLYEDLFLEHSVPPQVFFELLHAAKVKTAEPNATIVEPGRHFNSVLLITDGIADAWLDDTLLYRYEGNGNSSTRLDEDKSVNRGCVIGGTALVEKQVLLRPYKNRVVARTKTKYLEWTLEEMEKAMKKDKLVRAAMFSILYKELINGLRDEKRMRREREAKADQAGAGATLSHVEAYKNVLAAVIADGLVNQSEKNIVKKISDDYGVTQNQHSACLQSLGWTDDAWTLGYKSLPNRHSAAKLAPS